MERKTHTIDAANEILGRLATKIAVLLRGKDKPSFVLNKDMGDFVVVKNVGKLKYTGKKLEKKIYYRHSGYLGSLKATPLHKLLAKKPGEALKKAVYGMIPPNKLRARQMKRLKIEQ